MADTTTATTEKSHARRKIMTGVVTSAKMQKTVVVTVMRRVKSAEYKKYMSQRVKYKAHNERLEIVAGDRVEIIETRPLSKEKRWRVTRVLEKARDA